MLTVADHQLCQWPTECAKIVGQISRESKPNAQIQLDASRHSVYLLVI